MTVELTQDGYEPPDVASVLIMLRFIEYNSRTPGEVEQLDTQWCEMPVARRLAETLTELVSTVGEPITDRSS